LCPHPASIFHSTTRFLKASVHTTKISGSTKIPSGGMISPSGSRTKFRAGVCFIFYININSVCHASIKLGMQDVNKLRGNPTKKPIIRRQTDTINITKESSIDRYMCHAYTMSFIYSASATFAIFINFVKRAHCIFSLLLPI